MYSLSVLSTVGLALTLAGCGPSQRVLDARVPNIPHVRSSTANSVEVCCDRSQGESECATNHWTGIVQDACSGQARTMERRQDGLSTCVRYGCTGKVLLGEGNRCSATGTRTILLHFVVDPTFVKGSDWRDQIRTASAHAAWFFEPLGVSFAIAGMTEASLSTNTKALEDRFVELRKYKSRVNADIHIGLVSIPPELRAYGMSLAGLTSALLQNEVLVNNYHSGALSPVLVHELGHVFGAFHSEADSSLMSEACDLDNPWGKGFDKGSAAIIRITKCADFQKGPGALTPNQRNLIGTIFDALSDPSALNPLAIYAHQEAAKLKKQKKATDALQWERQAVQFQPGHPVWRQFLGFRLLEVGSYEEALTTFNWAAQDLHRAPSMELQSGSNGRQYPLHYFILDGTAAAYSKLWRYPEALAAYRELAKTYPDHWSAQIQAATILSKVGRYQEAIGHAEKARGLVPDNKHVAEVLADLNRWLEEDSKAVIPAAKIYGPAAEVSSQMKACHQSRVTGGPALTGRIVLQFSLDETGTTTEVKIRESTVKDSVLEECVLTVARTVSFPDIKKGPAKLSIPISF